MFIDYFWKDLVLRGHLCPRVHMKAWSFSWGQGTTEARLSLGLLSRIVVEKLQGLLCILRASTSSQLHSEPLFALLHTLWGTTLFPVSITLSWMYVSVLVPFILCMLFQNTVWKNISWLNSRTKSRGGEL